MNRVWFWHHNMFRFMPGPLEVSPGAQPTDAVATGGSWIEDGDTITFSPGWCRSVTMRECSKAVFPDGTEERRSSNVEVVW